MEKMRALGNETYDFKNQKRNRWAEKSEWTQLESKWMSGKSEP